MKTSISEATEVDVVIGAFILVPAKEIAKLAGFDERFFFYSEEMDLCYRFKKAGGKVFYLPATSVVHIGGATVGNIPWFKYKNHALAELRFFQKHFHGVHFLFLVLVHFLGTAIRAFLWFLSGVIRLKKRDIIRAYYHFKQLFIYPENVF
jgi:GT2 family glycosyltransferase